MNLKKLTLFVQLMILTIVVCCFCQGVLLLQNSNLENYYYSMLTHYLFLFISSAVILFINQMVAIKMKEQVGFVFLFSITVKLIVAYLFLSPILRQDTSGNNAEVLMFFILFLHFLAIDVYFTSKILDSKYENYKKE